MTMQIQDLGIRFDFSRARMTAGEWETLYELAAKRNAAGFLEDAVRGEIVNTDEKRQALHTSLRTEDADAPHFEDVRSTLSRVFARAAEVRQTVRCGAITDIVNIGIGGSSLGSEVLWHAFCDEVPGLRMHFLTASDPVLFKRICREVEPKKTLVVVSSKSMRTRETLINARAFLDFLLDKGVSAAALQARTFCVSANPQAPGLWGVPSENAFEMFEWVVGRFSVWSAISLPVVFAFGEDFFKAFLDGARRADAVALETKPESNPALRLALLAYRQLELGMIDHCLLPYDERLRKLPYWLEQLEMESLGKCRDNHGEKIDAPTSQLLWTVMADEGQHSVYQFLREINHACALTVFSVKPEGADAFATFQRLNTKTQIEALCRKENAYANALLHIALDSLTPRTLGYLMATYEAKTVMLAALYGVNPFHQPAVELGKRLLNAFYEVGEA